MNITINNAVVVVDASADVRKYCRDNLIIDNPDYISRERAGRWTGTIPRYMHLYEEIGNTIILPYGCRRDPEFIRITETAHKAWSKYPEIDDFRAHYKSNINLYPYQKHVVHAALAAKNGIIIMPCGSGKTQTALECIARIGLKTLWLTHTQDLLRQSMERAKRCFDVDPDDFGVITAGRVNIGRGITFATIQTMCRLDLDKYQKQWAVIVVDECQHCCGSPTRVSQFYHVVNSLYAPYKFGLTATPTRSDGLERSMYALLGPTIINVDKSAVSSRTCDVIVEKIPTAYEPDADAITDGDGTINYAALVSDLIEDEERREQISAVINDRCRKFSMVLANRVQYLQDLYHDYTGNAVLISGCGTSKKAKEERQSALDKLNRGEIDCIFATYKLAAEGLDCPNLRFVVFATPEKDERTVIQSVGRVARKADGKEFGTVIDFVDDFGMYQTWAKKRARYYKNLGAHIKNT